MDTKEKINLILQSKEINDDIKKLIPEPLIDQGYYLIYYPTSLYKEALIDVLIYLSENISIFYDKKIDSSKDYQDFILEKIDDYDCIGAIIYLNEDSLNDPFLYRLMKKVDLSHKSYFSINYGKINNLTVSGEILSESLSLPSEVKKLYKKVFANEITYLLGSSSYEEKIKALRAMKKENPFMVKIIEDSLIISGYKDPFAYKINVPPYLTIEDKKYKVIALGPMAFANMTFLETIYLPETIESIGGHEKIESDSNGYTFLNCFSLKEINIPKSCKHIYSNVFLGCKNLRVLDLRNVSNLEPDFIGDFNKPKLKTIYANNIISKMNNNYFDQNYNWLFLPDVNVVGCSNKENLKTLILNDNFDGYLDHFENSKIENIIFPSNYFKNDEGDEDCFILLENLPNLIKADYSSCIGNKPIRCLIENCPSLKEIIFPLDGKSLDLNFLNTNKQIDSIYLSKSYEAIIFNDYNALEKRIYEKMLEEEQESNNLNFTLSLSKLVLDNPNILQRKALKHYSKKAKLTFKQVSSLLEQTFVPLADSSNNKPSKLKLFFMKIITFIFIKISPSASKDLSGMETRSVLNSHNIYKKISSLKDIFLLANGNKYKIKGFKFIEEKDGYYHYLRSK